LAKVSQPILDRIDLHVELSAVPLHRITELPQGGRLDEERRLREVVLSARERQIKRSGDLNSALSSAAIRENLNAETEALRLLERAAEKTGLSARGYLRVLRVARTIADIAGEERVSTPHVAEAVQYRSLERIERYCRGGGSEHVGARRG
jgi:magnesium chelatase family protein